MYSEGKELYTLFYLHDEELILPESEAVLTLDLISHMGPEKTLTVTTLNNSSFLSFGKLIIIIML